MRCLLRVLPLLALVAGPAGAQTIFGLTFVDTMAGSRAQVVTIPAGSGVVSLLTGGPTGAASLAGPTAIDPAGDRYFFVGMPDGGSLSLFVVDTTDGSSESGTLSGVAFTNFFDIEYDVSGDVLYGLVTVGGNIQLVTIDDTSPGLGGMTAAAGNAGMIGIAGGSMDLDPTANFYYLKDASNNLVAITTATGSVADSGATSALSGLEADPDSFEVFALQTTGSGFRIVELSTADLTFGQETTTGADLTGAASSAGVKTSDPAGNRFYFIATPSSGPNMNMPTLYAADTSDPQLDLLADSDVLSGVDTSPDGLEFDPTTPVSPTPTPTATATSTATPTSSPTATASNTPTPTNSPTPSPTGSATATPTITPTATSTATPSATPTSTATATATATSTVSVTAPEIPTLSTPVLALLAFVLAAAGILLARRRG